MIIICPNCGKRYKIADESLGTGRKVKCANCGHRWFAAPPSDYEKESDIASQASNETDDQKALANETDSSAENQTNIAEGEPERTVENTGEDDDTARIKAAEESARSADKLAKTGKFFNKSPHLQTTDARSSRVGLLGWLLVVLIILSLAGLVIGRNEIVAIFPKSADYYRMLGLPVTVEIGLEIRGMTSVRDNESELPTIVISGEIHNVTDTEREVPPIRIALLDSEREEIDFGLFDPPQSFLIAGGKMEFEARLINPSADARNYSITFEASPG